MKHSGQEVCVSASSSGFTPWVSRYACGVIQSLRPGDNRVSSRTRLQPQQMGSSVGAMNVSLLGAEGESRVVRIMVLSIDIKYLLSSPVDGGVCDTGSEEQSICRTTSVKPRQKFLVDLKRLTCMKEAEAGIWSCLQSVDIRLTLDLSTVCTLPQEREDRGLICGVAT